MLLTEPSSETSDSNTPRYVSRSARVPARANHVRIILEHRSGLLPDSLDVSEIGCANAATDAGYVGNRSSPYYDGNTCFESAHTSMCWGLTNQGNRRPPRRAAPPVGVRVDRVVRPHHCSLAKEREPRRDCRSDGRDADTVRLVNCSARPLRGSHSPTRVNPMPGQKLPKLPTNRSLARWRTSRCRTARSQSQACGRSMCAAGWSQHASHQWAVRANRRHDRH